MEDDLQKASMEDLREKYGDYPVWAAIQRAYGIGVDEGFYEAAKTPSAWYVEDHGEVFHLGDRVWRGDRQYSLVGWNFIGGYPMRVQPKLGGWGPTEFHCIAHNKPDSWEKWKKDLKQDIAYQSVKSTNDIIDEFFTRAKKLGGCDE